MNDLPFRLALAVSLGLPLVAHAQPRVSPADPQASAPALRYRSAFVDYQAWQDVKPGDWRQLNAQVAPASAPAVGPAHPRGHAGHAMPGGKP